VGGALKLRITLDTAGKITHVAHVSGDSGLGKVLIRKLTGATSATCATGPDRGTVELTITVAST
jgi:pantoate kinase